MSKLKGFSIKYPLTVFFIIAYALTWLLWAPSIASSRGLIPPLPKMMSVVGSFGPALAAILVSIFIGGRKALYNLLSGLLKWRVHFKWFIVALLPIAINAVLITAFALMSGSKPDLSLNNFFMFIPTFFFWLVLGGPLGEEIGWRGFALPRLQEKRSAFVSSVFLAVIWFGWHLPRYLDPHMAVGGGIAILIFGLQTLVFSILFTWLYNQSKESLLIMILFHAAINSLSYMFTMFFPNFTIDEKYGIYYNLMNLVWFAIFLIWAFVTIFFNNKKVVEQEAINA